MLQISEQEIKDRLAFDNPWWEDGHISDLHNSYPRRAYFPPFKHLVQEKKVRRATILMGPRRVGKTVMVYHTIQDLLATSIPPSHILYLSLETPLYTGLSLEKLVLLFRDIQGHSRHASLYIFFDEIQYLKDWEIHLKSLVDSYPTYRFVATGSAAAALRLQSRESGAGRFTDFMLPPLSFAEYLRFTELDTTYLSSIDSEEAIYETSGKIITARDMEALNAAFVDYINYGGYPEAATSEHVRTNSARFIKSDIIDKVLLRDLPSLYGISDIQELNRLFTTLAYNTGNEVSLEKLAQSSGVAKNTLRRYIEYLEAAFLIQRLYRVDQTGKRFKRATSFKVYLVNPAMRAALFGPITSESPSIGALVETAVFGHKSYMGGLNHPYYYARWRTGEVDFVWPSPIGDFHITEAKWSDKPLYDGSLRASVIRFCKQTGTKHATITTRTVAHTLLDQDIQLTLVPNSLYCYRRARLSHGN